jgi:GNAT superfamily N-acetyltransferase
VLTSRVFREPFFNRACFLECRAVGEHLAEAERALGRTGLATTVTVNQSCLSSRRVLEAAGYRPSETMIVMLSSGRTMPPESEVHVLRTSPKTLPDWVRAYLLSFYGDEALLAAASKTVQRLAKSRTVTLLEARLGGEVAGVLALFRSPGLIGIYCVGTVPKFRRKGVAGALLRRSSEIAASEGRRLALQTLESDGVEAFYKKRGFAELYRKMLLEKQS